MLTRTVRYRYAQINGRSLLAEIDGPLPNGPTNSPKDSDVTRLEWDRRGSVVIGMAEPGGFIHRVTYDAGGRARSVMDAEGFATQFQYDPFGRALRITSSGSAWAKAGLKPVVQIVRYDALGNPIETGTANGDHYRPQTRQAFDAARRLLWRAEALGILKRATYDNEGNLLSSTVSTRSFEQTEQYRYDDVGRLVEVSDSTGVVRRIDDTFARRGAAGVSAFHVLRDDFGREVRVTSRSHGTRTMTYDAAGRRITQRDDKGTVQTWVYDLAGRQIQHILEPKSGVKETITWRYKGSRLAEVRDPVQAERIEYNERGLPAMRMITLKLANGAEATYVTRYRYTADGSLQSQSLPDGTQILYERNGQGQVVAVSQQTSPWTFFGWGQTTLVKDLERDLIGLRQLTYGNGIQGQWQRSKQGVLARVVYTRPESPSVDPSIPAAAKQALSDGILGKLLPAAHAQTLPAPASKLPGALDMPADPKALFDARLLYDGAGNVLLQNQQGFGPQQTQAYAYDSESQLVAAQSVSPSSPVTAATTGSNMRVWRYHYDANGNRVLAQENVAVTEMGHTRQARYDLASNAFSTPADLGREYIWNAQGQLINLRQGNRELARYRYNHQGLRVSKQTGSESTHSLYNEQRQRIADLDANGRITRQYLWLGDHLIATLDARQPKVLQASADGFWQELTQTIQALWSSITSNTDRLAFIHVNHLGAPVAATNQAGQVIWHADYAPYGQLIRTAVGKGHSAYTLALRLPGQWEDAESGLYYNDFRYYDPQAGRYLSPDPLGQLAEALGSPNAYAYVNNNPLSYIDPWGLILFAFDGTKNSPRDRTNVYWFMEHYQANDPSLSQINGHRPYYVEGPGGAINDVGPDKSWDAAIAHSLDDKIKTQLKRLNDYVKAKTEQVAAQRPITKDNPLTITLDIVGFSRGAAAARHFSNQVATIARSGGYRTLTDRVYCVQVNIRFMGLFDTVLSTAKFPSASTYNLRIAEAVQYAAHAVAVNEHRKMFPGESIEPSYANIGFSSNRIERGFVGAHSDIGGGYNGVPNNYETYDGGDMSDVALNWIVAQAKSAGVPMDNVKTHLQIVSNPVVHDERKVAPWNWPIMGGANSEREFRYPNAPDGVTQTQTTAPIAGLTTPQAQNFISYYPAPVGSKTGTVDMGPYLAWLKANYSLTLN